MCQRAETIAVEAGKRAIRFFDRLSSLTVETKGPLDLVTQADREVEKFLIAQLRKAYPADGIYGEEGGHHAGTSGRIWVLDPIDGTFNFVRGSDQWTISIGLLENGVPVFGVLYCPMRDELYVGGRDVQPRLNGRVLQKRTGMNRQQACAALGFNPLVPVGQRLQMLGFVWREAGMAVRSCGSATISLIEVGRGQADGYIGIGESYWDIAAACAIFGPIGILNTVNWKQSKPDTKFSFAAGTSEFLQSIESAVPFGVCFKTPDD